jgi:alpha-L-arabinofuranosidase
MFATHVGDTFVPTTVTGDSGVLYVSASLRQSDRAVFVKVVNTSAVAQATAITLEGATCVSATLTASVLASAAPTDTNSFASPTEVAPLDSTMAGVGASFSFTFPAGSVTVLSLPDVQ